MCMLICCLHVPAPFCVIYSWSLGVRFMGAIEDVCVIDFLANSAQFNPFYCRSFSLLHTPVHTHTQHHTKTEMDHIASTAAAAASATLSSSSSSSDPSSSETLSLPRLAVVVGAICLLHVAAFAFWVYKFSTTSDKRIMEFPKKD